MSTIATVQQIVRNWQQDLRMTRKLFTVGDVFCPMCEIWHENTTWCQANMEVSHEC